MTSTLAEPLEMFCRQTGITLPFKILPIRAGRNSQVSLLSNKDGKWVLKNYYQPVGGDKRDRLETEYSFLVFLNQAGVSSISVPLAKDRALHVAVYSYLPGQRPDRIDTEHISQAARFITEINGLKTTTASALPLASDACLSLQAHLQLTESRVGRLLEIVPKSEVERQAHEFVRNKLTPLWAKVKIEFSSRRKAAGLTDLLPPEDRILSPSDFGFHNTLEHETKLSFVDFEYAGWDDPAKLICDFLCQPELPVTESQGQQFLEEVLLTLPRAREIRHRVKLLLPVHRLKWCCILLNEFREEDRRRREHAGLSTNNSQIEQLGKAKNYFDTYLDALT